MMQSEPQRSHFGRKTSLIIIGLVSLIMITAISALLAVNIDDTHKRLEEDLTVYTEMIQSSLVSIVWHMDRQAIEDVLNSLTKNEFIIYAELTVDGQLIARKSQIGYTRPDLQTLKKAPGLVVRKIPIIYLDQPIGQIKIVINQRKALLHQLIPQLIKTILLALIIIVFSSIIIIIIAKKFVFTPLTKLEDIAVSVMKGEMDVPETFSQFTRREDIFGILGKAFVEMVHQLRNSIKNLDTEVRQRTRELEISKEEAVAASKAKSMFLSNMSHEIRTPLNTILAMTDLLKESPSLSDQAKLLQSLEVSGETLLTLTNDILDLAKIESGQFQLEEIPFDVRELVGNLDDIFKFQAAEKSLQFTCILEDNVFPQRMGDPTRIKQVLINLLGNAIKFTQEGGVWLIVRNQSENGAFLRFIVKDTGIGISVDKQSEIFESFTQADMSTTRKYGGSGLGLAITQSIVEIMNGSIQIESAEGEGTEFTIDLPLDWIAPDQTDSTLLPIDTNIQDYSSIEIEAFPEMHILLVEDNRENQNVIYFFLEGLPVKLDVAQNGYEGIRKVRQHNYDCVLMDIQMPVIDGFEATRAIRQWETELEQSPVFIIALTAYAFKEEHQKCYEAGCDTVLSKPIKKKVLLDSLRLSAGSKNGTSDQARSIFKETISLEMKDLIPDFFEELKESFDLIDKAVRTDDLTGTIRLATGIMEAAKSYDLTNLYKILSSMKTAARNAEHDQLNETLKLTRRYIHNVSIEYTA